MAAKRPNRLALLVGIAAAIFFVVIPFLGWLARVWTDYLWYVDLGQQSVFVTRIVSQLTIFAIFFVVSFALLYGNMFVARRLAPRAVPIGLPEAMPPQVQEIVMRFRVGLGPVLDKAILLGALVLAFFDALSMSQQWVPLRLALTGEKFGYNDPQFGRDVGFWVFSLPAQQILSGWLTGILVLVTILTLLVHLVDGAIQPWAKLKGFAPHVKAHLSVLLAALVASRAYAYWIDVWMLDLSPRGQVLGASYTDVHAQLPAYRILIFISIGIALLLLFNIRYRGWRLPAIAIGVWVGAAILIGGVWPGLVQRFVVTPNEAALEAPYIKRNIVMTRQAYDLTAVEGRAFPATENLKAADIINDRQTLSNVRLWDPVVAQTGFSQLQSIRPYYDFADVDVDRYTIDGAKRQVLISAREMNSSGLPDQAQTWVNRHLVYTHGFGIVMSPVSESDPRGLPKFLIGDVPPRISSDVSTESANTDLAIKEPRLYFGEDTRDYVIVDTGIKEFDYPAGEKNATYEYKGAGGVEIGSLFRRIAWALRLSSSQVLFSEYVRPESRVLLRRDLTSRLEELAPWLRYEDDPYPVLTQGRLVWVVDAYTDSNMFPYSERLPGGGENYLRNSVKVTVDAFTGETTFYAYDPKDPVLQAWRDIFPSLITDLDKMPEALKPHLRYPTGMFAAQAEIYRTYHMTDVTVFYNKEDQWEIPGVRQGTTMHPFFVLLKLPGATEEHFYLMQPYVPRNRDNMIGWMAVSSDPANYGERTVYLFPKERVILGPEQVSARINQDAAISPQLSLWNQRGSSVLLGNMLVLPIKDSIIYIQPLFLQSEQTAIPELTRVIVVYSEKVEMDKTLGGALLRVFGEVPSGSQDTTGSGAPGTSSATAAQAQKLFEEAVAAQRKGDWATYGDRLDQLGALLEKLASGEATKTR